MEIPCVGELQNMSCALTFSVFALPGAAANGILSLWKESLWKLLMELGGALENRILFRDNLMKDHYRKLTCVTL